MLRHTFPSQVRVDSLKTVLFSRALAAESSALRPRSLTGEMADIHRSAHSVPQAHRQIPERLDQLAAGGVAKAKSIVIKSAGTEPPPSATTTCLVNSAIRLTAA